MSYMLGMPPKIATRGTDILVRPSRPSEQATVTHLAPTIDPPDCPAHRVTGSYVNGTRLID